MKLAILDYHHFFNISLFFNSFELIDLAGFALVFRIFDCYPIFIAIFKKKLYDLIKLF